MCLHTSERGGFGLGGIPRHENGNGKETRGEKKIGCGPGDPISPPHRNLPAKPRKAKPVVGRNLANRCPSHALTRNVCRLRGCSRVRYHIGHPARVRKLCNTSRHACTGASDPPLRVYHSGLGRQKRNQAADSLVLGRICWQGSPSPGLRGALQLSKWWYPRSSGMPKHRLK